MVDIGTGLALVGSAKLLEKLLGPTAEYLGEGVRDLTNRRIQNLRIIFQKALDRSGGQLEKPGVVPPRVLEQIVSKGSWIEDELTAEYFGGVLSSSRTDRGRDDRASELLSLLSRLSSYQIRGHYMAYTAIKQLYDGCGRSVDDPSERKDLRVFMPIRDVARALDLGKEEKKRFASILEHIAHGLEKESLLPTGNYSGKGVVVEPSVLGSQLYLWAHGRSDLRANSLLDPRVRLNVSCTVWISDRCRKAKPGEGFGETDPGRYD